MLQIKEAKQDPTREPRHLPKIQALQHIPARLVVQSAEKTSAAISVRGVEVVVFHFNGHMTEKQKKTCKPRFQ
jgi:hypothetical protein